MKIQLKLLLLIAIYLGLVACGDTAKDNSNKTNEQDSIALQAQVSYDSTMFKDAIRRENELYKKVFVPVLDTSWRQDSADFIRKLDKSYGLLEPNKGVISNFYQQVLFGYGDTVYVIEYTIPLDSICEHYPYQQQFIFNRDGQLLHKDQAMSVKFVQIWEDQAPVFMVLNSSCEGEGKHHFYKYENGRLIDIFNVFEGGDNTPNTYLNLVDSAYFDPFELVFEAIDIDQDGYNDIVFRGKKVVLRDNKGKQYPTWRPFQKELLEYKFIYKPAKGLFFLDK
ncbi:MAG: hypothetical protein GY810_26925 [Aureispira sp.]|nr:hypothetical protein [Aureispira sp.]